MNVDNTDNNKEKTISVKAYNESYFMIHKLISEIFIIPLLIYIISISYVIHISTFNPPLKSHININLSKKRKNLFLILIFLYIGQLISILKVTNSESSSSSVSNSITLITLLFFTMDIMSVLLTLYFIDERNKKYIKIDKYNSFQLFFVLNIIYFLLDLVNEIVYGLFTFLTPITFCYLIYFQIFYYLYPNDSDHSKSSKGLKYIVVTEYDKDLIQKKQCSIKRNNNYNNLINSKKYFPMSNLSSRISMLGSEKYDLNNEGNTNNNINSNNRIGSNDGNNKINKLINNLYDPNNIDYLQNSYEGLLDIKVKFQSNFFIDYITYYNNKTNNKSSNDKYFPLLNNQYDMDSNSDEHFDVANFYTSIIFNFNVFATSSYYVTNKNLSKSLDEFFLLDNIIESEFTDDRYSISLIKSLPKLNVKKCFEGLSINKKDFDINKDNNDVLLNCILNTKNICEKFINDIISNPHFIIPEVLLFLEIRDKNVFQIYININKQIKKKDDNILLSLIRKEDDNNDFIISRNSNYIYKNNEFISNINIKILKGNYINDNNKNKNDKNNFKNYLLLISLNYEESTKYIRKKLEETIFIIQEFNKLLLANNYYNSNNKNNNNEKEINSDLVNNFKEFVNIYNKINGTNFRANQSFKLIKNDNYKKIFREYSNSNINNKDDLFHCFIICIEKILQLLINHYLEEIYNSNQIIKEYFNDFLDYFWSVDKLKNYIKYNNNFINLFKNEISDKSINSIFVVDKNYIYINVNYNINIFYTLFFKITTNTNFIQLEKKYEFNEVKNYIDLMKVELGLSLVWPKRCFESNDNNENNIENIHTFRLNLMSTYLNKIFNTNKIFNIKNWKKIFYDDKLYREVCEIKLKENKTQNKKTEKIIENKNNINIDDFLYKENKNIIINEEKDCDIINDNYNSFGSLYSNISRNSNVKKLLDV